MLNVELRKALNSHPPHSTFNILVSLFQLTAVDRPQRSIEAEIGQSIPRCPVPGVEGAAAVMN
jgi:hypothetical protein